MHVNHLSLDKVTYFSGFVTLFCYRVRFEVFKQMQRVNPIWKGADLVKSKVNPMPCKFAKVCSVNNLTNLPGYFSAFDHTSLQWNQNGTVTFLNIGCLSNDDDEGNENVPGYQMNALFFCLFFFLNFFAFIAVNSLKMANKGEPPYGFLETTPNFGLREEIEFVPVFTS